MPFHITHPAYTNDLLIFLRGTIGTLCAFKTFLTSYDKASGEKVNYNKSSFIPSSNISIRRQTCFSGILAMHPTNLPFCYLGSMLHKGFTRAHHCTALLYHIDRRQQCWHNKLLSQAGMLVLLRSVLSSLPLHIMAAGGLPKSVIKIVEQKMAHFLLGTESALGLMGQNLNPLLGGRFGT